MSGQRGYFTLALALETSPTFTSITILITSIQLGYMIHSGGLCVLLYVTVSTESVVAMALQCWHCVNLYSTHYHVFYLNDYYTCADKPIFNNRLHGGNFSFYYVDVILWWEAFPQKSFQIWKLFWYRCALPDHRLALHTSNLKYNTCNLHYVIISAY